MQKKSIFRVSLLVVLAGLAIGFSALPVLAKEEKHPPSYYLGTLREAIQDVQKLPDIVNGSICDKDEEGFKANFALLNKRIADVQWLVKEMGLKDTMLLQRIPNVFIKTKECGAGAKGTHYADYAREKLQIEIENAGLE